MFCLSEKTVTLECVQLKALNYRFASPLRYEMVEENVRFSLNKQQTYIDEDNSFPQGEVLNDTESFCNRQRRQTLFAYPSSKSKKVIALRQSKSRKRSAVHNTIWNE